MVFSQWFWEKSFSVQFEKRRFSVWPDDICGSLAECDISVGGHVWLGVYLLSCWCARRQKSWGILWSGRSLPKHTHLYRLSYSSRGNTEVSHRQEPRWEPDGSPVWNSRALGTHSRRKCRPGELNNSLPRPRIQGSNLGSARRTHTVPARILILPQKSWKKPRKAAEPCLRITPLLSSQFKIGMTVVYRCFPVNPPSSNFLVQWRHNVSWSWWGC